MLRTAEQERTSVVAYAVMPNHLHLLVVHGSAPLWRFMQPLLRRIALLVQRTHKRRGHVFERRYRDHICLDASYARNVIAYIHLNPVRAGLCSDPGDYEWTSHKAYSSDADGNSDMFSANVALHLHLFAEEPDQQLSEWRTSYRHFIAWRATIDHRDDSEVLQDAASMRPWSSEGDAFWRQHVGNLPFEARRLLCDQRILAARPDIEDISRSAIRELAPEMSLDWLRNNGKTRVQVNVRDTIIARCLAAGYANYQIARFLRVTSSTVSKVRSELRLVRGAPDRVRRSQ